MDIPVHQRSGGLPPHRGHAGDRNPDLALPDGQATEAGPRNRDDLTVEHDRSAVTLDFHDPPNYREIGQTNETVPARARRKESYRKRRVFALRQFIRAGQLAADA